MQRTKWMKKIYKKDVIKSVIHFCVKINYHEEFIASVQFHILIIILVYWNRSFQKYN